MLHLEVIDEPGRLLPLRDQWEALLRWSGNNYVYLTYEWVTTFWRHFGKAGHLFVVVIRDERDVIGIAPLMIDRNRWRGIPARYVRFLGFPLSDRSDFIFGGRKRDCVFALMDLLLAERERWDILALTEVLESSENLAHLEAYCAGHRMRAEKRLASAPPFLPLDRDWESIAAGFSGKFRRRLRVDRDRLKEAGPFRFERIVPDRERATPLLEALKDLERRSWKGDRGLGFLSGARNEAFASEVSLACAARGWLDVAVLTLDARPVAYRYGFRYDHKFWDYNVAYDPGYRRLSPGHVLLGMLIEDSCRLGLHEVDASRGLVEGHVLAQWTPRRRLHYDLSVFHEAPYSRLMGVLHGRLKPAVRRLLGRRKAA